MSHVSDANGYRNQRSARASWMGIDDPSGAKDDTSRPQLAHHASNVAIALSGLHFQCVSIPQYVSDCRNETDDSLPVIGWAKRPDFSAWIAQVVTIAKKRILHFFVVERSCADKALAAYIGLTLVRWCQDNLIELPNAGGLVQGRRDNARTITAERRAVHPPVCPASTIRAAPVVASHTRAVCLQMLSRRECRPH